MNFLRLHWQDVGIGFAIIGGMVLATVAKQIDSFSILLWLSLISLLVHQFEEYRYPGYFPGMVNSVLFKSAKPDRYPLNTNTSLIVNVIVGWLAYFLAAFFGRHAIWLAMGTILVSAGNCIAHVFLFNIRGKTLYNPGLLTSVLLFLPIVIVFFKQIVQYHLASPSDWVCGIVLGIFLNVVGIVKLIDWLKDEHTPFIFPNRCLIPKERK